MSDDALREALEQMKKKLAFVSMKANRWPKPETNIIRFDPDGTLETSDEFKRGAGFAFSVLWPCWETIEAALLDRGILDQPIELTTEEDNAIPF